MSDAPVGVLGDGWGVLALADALQARLPREDVLVLADAAWAPWGARDPRRVRLRVEALADDLAARGAKLLVLASAVAATDAGDAFAARAAAADLPAVVLDGGVRAAAQAARGLPVAVVVADGAIRPRPFGLALRRTRLEAPATVVTWDGAREAVEAGRVADATAGALAADLAARLVGARVGAVALADPHAARLRPALAAALDGSGIAIADCATATSARVWTLLRRTGLVAHRRRAGRRLLVSSDPVRGAAGLRGAAGGPPWAGGVGR